MVNMFNMSYQGRIWHDLKWSILGAHFRSHRSMLHKCTDAPSDSLLETSTVYWCMASNGKIILNDNNPFMHASIYIYIYIYIQRERDLDRDLDLDLVMHTVLERERQTDGGMWVVRTSHYDARGWHKRDGHTHRHWNNFCCCLPAIQSIYTLIPMPDTC